MFIEWNAMIETGVDSQILYDIHVGRDTRWPQFILYTSIVNQASKRSQCALVATQW